MPSVLSRSRIAPSWFAVPSSARSPTTRQKSGFDAVAFIWRTICSKNGTQR